MSYDLECPYCDAELEVNHDDGFGYEENVNHEMECSECEKSFVFTTSIMYYYSPEKADCLNDGNHDYKIQRGHPKAFMQMQCTMCGDKREPTEKEREELQIGTKEEYFNILKKQ